MDSGIAALLGSAIGFLGSIVGTAVVPFFTRKAERKDAKERERKEALRNAIPPLLEAGVSLVAGDTNAKQVASAMKAVAQLELWLAPDEWQIGRIAMLGILPGQKGRVGKRYATTATLLPAWLRGEYSPAEAAKVFTKSTGIEVERILPTDTPLN